MLKRIERPKSLSEQVAEALRIEIVAGKFKLGEMLSESRISTSLGVSRTPVREAFARLEREGLLVIKPKSGTYVFLLEADALRDICELRACLELEALRRAADRAHAALAEDIGTLKTAMESAHARVDLKAYRTLDQATHEAIVQHSGNQLLIETYRPIANKVDAIYNNCVIDEEQRHTTHDQHMALARAILENDIEQALEIMRAHLDSTRCVFMKSLFG